MKKKTIAYRTITENTNGFHKYHYKLSTFNHLNDYKWFSVVYFGTYSIRIYLF